MMIRKTLVACTLALAAFTVAAPAEADVRVYLGVPFHPYQVGPGWRYYDGYGWYDYGRYGEFRPYYRNRLTCNQARRMVDRNGYSDVDVRECAGRVYAFRATTRKGKRVTVYVNSLTGDMWR
jgi:hypothetical protein